MGGNFDDYILMPVTVFEKAYGLRDRGGDLRSVNVTVRAVSPELMEDAMEETRAVLRSVRGLSPRDRTTSSSSPATARSRPSTPRRPV